MPYKRKEDKAAQMRRYRAEQKAENEEALEKLKASPEFQQLSKAKQQQVENDFLKVLAILNKHVEEKEQEIEQYIKLKVNGFYDSRLPKIKAALALTLAIQEKALQLKELFKK